MSLRPTFEEKEIWAPGKFIAAQQPQYEIVFRRIQERLRDVAAKQEKLANSREELLIKRERARAFSKRVQAKRIEASSTEAEFMNIMRSTISRGCDILSKFSSEAFEKVEVVRDELGALEEDYRQAESELTGLEWTYMDEENDFYQLDLLEVLSGGLELDSSLPKDVEALNPSNRHSLLPSSPPPPPPLLQTPLLNSNTSFLSDLNQSIPSAPPLPPLTSRQSQHRIATSQAYHAVTAELKMLGQTFDRLRYEQSKRLEEGTLDHNSLDNECYDDPNSSPFAAMYFNLLENISSREVEAQQLEAEALQHEFRDSIAHRYNSDSAHLMRQVSPLPVGVSGPSTEKTVPLITQDPAVKPKVGDWLLKHLKANVTEKTLYLNILDDHGVEDSEDETWEDRAVRFWGSDCSSELHDDHNELTVTRDTSQHSDVIEDTNMLPLVRERLNCLDLTLNQRHPDTRNSDPDFVVACNEQPGLTDPSTLPGTSCQRINHERPEDLQNQVISVQPGKGHELVDVLTFNDKGVGRKADKRRSPVPSQSVSVSSNMLHTNEFYNYHTIHEQRRSFDKCRITTQEEQRPLPIIEHESVLGDSEIIHLVPGHTTPVVAAVNPDTLHVSYKADGNISSNSLCSRSSLQYVTIHITPPSRPSSRPASDREVKSCSDQIRTFFTKSRHRRSLSTNDAVSSRSARYHVRKGLSKDVEETTSTWYVQRDRDSQLGKVLYNL